MAFRNERGQSASTDELTGTVRIGPFSAVAQLFKYAIADRTSAGVALVAALTALGGASYAGWL